MIIGIPTKRDEVSRIIKERRTRFPLSRTYPAVPPKKGVIYFKGHTGDRKPVFTATCKFFGCKCATDIVCDGVKDSEDRQTAEATAIERGWKQSEFDGRWLCPNHA